MRALDSLTAFNACTRTAFFLFTAGAGVGCLGCLTGAASTATGSSMGRATGSNAAKLSPSMSSNVLSASNIFCISSSLKPFCCCNKAPCCLIFCPRIIIFIATFITAGLDMSFMACPCQKACIFSSCSLEVHALKNKPQISIKNNVFFISYTIPIYSNPYNNFVLCHIDCCTMQYCCYYPMRLHLQNDLAILEKPKA